MVHNDTDILTSLATCDVGTLHEAAASADAGLAAALQRSEREQRVMAGLAEGGTTFELMGIK